MTDSIEIRHSADTVLCTALDIAEGLIKNGGSVHRAEDTVERVCHALGASHVEAFCIPSFITVTIRMKNGDYASQSRRILQSANHFMKLDSINNLSRELCSGEMTLAEVQEELRHLKAQKGYPALLRYVAASAGAASFAAFFGGTIWDTLAAALVGAAILPVEEVMTKNKSTLSVPFLTSLIAGVLSVLLPYIGIGSHYDKIMIGTIMLQTPGLLFGASLRDLLCGDTLSGIFQLIQSILKAAILAFGYIIAIYLLRPLIG